MAIDEVPLQRSARRRLGEVLVAQRVLTPEQLRTALDAQADPGAAVHRKRLGEVVVELGLVDEHRLAAALAEALGLEVVDLRSVTVDVATARLVPRSVCERHGLVVVERTPSGGVRVALTDPTNVVAFDDVRLYTGAAEVTAVVTTESRLRHCVARVWSLAENSSDVATLFDDHDGDRAGEPDADPGEAPVVRLVNDIYADAVRAGASDVHIEPQAGELRVRFRVDGLLRDVTTVPKRVAAAVVSRVKVTSGLDIAERRRPQDGRTRLALESGRVDARVSTLPTVHGEKVVVRLLPAADDVPRLTDLGLTAHQRDALLGGLLGAQGLILITGPTGSGKTSTLYSALRQLRTPERNVVTLEDPVEIELPGITQVQVHERSGLTFASGLRSVLRQDPDVVLVGEVRDTETAELALRASLTGHLVLTTLHTNDAVAALTRLVDMGIAPYLVASSLAMVVAQRLVRVPCAGCAAPYVPSPRTLALLGLGPGDLAGATPVRGRGCPSCGGTGYRGRTGVYEVLPVTAAVRRVLLSSPTEEALRAAARDTRVMTLRTAGLAKAAAGETTYEEIVRVTQVDASDGGSCRVCERGLGDDMVVCPWCATPVDRGRCAGCARPLDADWVVCPWCRTAAPPPSGAVTAAGEAPRVLVVQPEPAALAGLVTALRDAYDVDTATTAEAALAALGGTPGTAPPYDAVVLDEALPDLGGGEVVRLLRADPATATLPVLLCGGTPREPRDAATDHLPAPSEPRAVAERLAVLCAREPADAARSMGA